ncbi:hypothetical protein AURDEDRAFT_129900 [Auricularia subglabra TFB-10046 SS5]|uniref:Uncharacterized protein n=1 Tax=Auricularia subglabra (strain TFB-10046 / SS5) TaxID=717982 RepID=J0WUZ7_AURST|nr:hypothetical protein AURDEDRAFT_129900 [Auricularia subglabra TFB-10046 SS5]
MPKYSGVARGGCVREKLEASCLQLHGLLASFSTLGGLTPEDKEIFQKVWNNIVRLSRGLPHGRFAMRQDNYKQAYVVVGRVYLQVGYSRGQACSLTYGRFQGDKYFERRFFPSLNATGYMFSTEFIFVSPDGSFYGSYRPVKSDNEGATDVQIKAVKLSDLGLRSYEYPPDIPLRLRNRQTST